MSTNRDDHRHGHVVPDTSPGPVALLVVLGAILGALWALRGSGAILAAFSGATAVARPLEHLADVGTAWQPRLSSTAVWVVAAVLWLTGCTLAIVVWSWLSGLGRRPRDAGWATPQDLRRGGLRVPRWRMLAHAAAALWRRLTAGRDPTVDVTRRTTTPGRVVVGRARGRLVATPRSHSLIVFGPSGSGKTSGFAVPAVLEWDGPAVVSSVKSDLLAITGTARATRGAVMVYDPLDRLGSHDRVGWDLLGGCDSYEGAAATAQALMGLSDFGTVSKGDFWQASAVGLLGPLLLGAARGGMSISTVRRWLNTANWDDPARLLAGDPEAAETLEGATKHTPKDTALSYVASARVALMAYSTPAAVKSTMLAPTVDADRLLDSTATLYLVGEEDDQELLRPLFVGMVDAIMRRAARRTNQGVRADAPLLMLLDEAANSTPLPDLDRYASTSRDRGVQLVTVWQDLAQVEQRYSDRQARTILNNHQATVMLSGVTDHLLLDRMSRLLGDERVTQRQRGSGHHGRSTSESEGWRPLASPDELRRLPTNTALLLHANTRAARLRLRPYYRVRRWRHLADRWQPGDRDSDRRERTRRQRQRRLGRSFRGGTTTPEAAAAGPAPPAEQPDEVGATQKPAVIE